MGDVAEKEGRTVLFVSHNMIAIKNLCSNLYLLEEGKLAYKGTSSEGVDFYLKMGQANSEFYHVSTSQIKWLGVSNISLLSDLIANEDLPLSLKFESGEYDLDRLFIDCEIFNEKEENVIHIKSKYIHDGFNIAKRTKFTINFIIKSPKLTPGKYHIMLYIYSGDQTLLWIDKIYGFSISSRCYFGQSIFFDKLNSVIIPEFTMEAKYDNSSFLPSGIC